MKSNVLRQNKFEEQFPLSRGDKRALQVSAVVIMALVFLTFFFTPWWWFKGEQLVGNLSADGSVQRRIYRSLQWGKMNQGRIFLKDYVYTPDKVTSKVRFLNGQVLEITPNTLVQIDEYSDTGVEVVLFFGNAFGVNIRRRPGFDIPYIDDELPGIAGLESRMPEIRPRERVPLLDGVKTLVPLDRLAHFEIFLLKPENRSYVNVSKSPWFEFLWTPIPLQGVHQKLEIATQADFGDGVTFEPDENSFAVHRLVARFDRKYNLYWKISATKKDEFKVADPAYYFEMK